MSRDWITALLIVVVFVLFAATPAYAGRIYWTRNYGDAVPYLEDIIASAQTNGSSFFEHYRRTDVTLHDIAVDSTHRRLYWTEFGQPDERIVRGDTNSCIELLVEGEGTRIALDVLGGNIYWTENTVDGGRILRANLDLTSVEVLADGLNHPTEIDIDSPGGKIYWYDDFDGTIQRSNLDGSNVEVQFDVPHLSGLQVDSAAQKIYWADWSAGTFQRADFDGSNVEVLAPQVRVPFVIDPTAETVYWEASGPEDPLYWGIIKRADLDGSNEAIVWAGGEADTMHLAFDQQSEPIPISCGVLVPALGTGAAGFLALLLFVIGARALRSPSPGRPLST